MPALAFDNKKPVLDYNEMANTNHAFN